MPAGPAQLLSPPPAWWGPRPGQGERMASLCAGPSPWKVWRGTRPLHVALPSHRDSSKGSVLGPHVVAAAPTQRLQGEGQGLIHICFFSDWHIAGDQYMLIELNMNDSLSQERIQKEAHPSPKYSPSP